MSIDEAAVSIATSAATVNRDNPWPGLLPFREIDEDYFQGRQSEAEELLRLVLRERLIVLFGLSGLGKSSLLQAGLFPKLRQKNVFPVYLRLDFSEEKPLLAAQVIATIAREASTHQIEAPAARAGETLWEYFHRESNNFWNARNRPVMPLLVFDQFEEVFTLGRRDPGCAAATEEFLRQLGELAEGRPPATLKAWIDEHPEEAGAFSFGQHHYKILLGIREDFLPDLEALRAGMPTVALNRMRLQRMNGEAALLVVSQAQHLIDPDVAEQVVRFVAADKANLPLAQLEIEPALLSVVCRELNNHRQNLGESKISADLLKGSQEQVLTDFYERSTADLAPEVRSFVEDKLLTVSGYRDSVALENALNTPGVSRKDIDTLVERRLVRREERGGTQRLELTHDLLAGVVRASRDSRRQREAEEEERAALLQAQEEENRALLKAKEEERLELERAQEQERTERDRRDLQRSRIAAVVFLTLALVTAVTAIWASRKEHQALRDMTRAKMESDRAHEKSIEATINLSRAKEETALAQKQTAAAQIASDRAHDKMLQAEAQLRLAQELRKEAELAAAENARVAAERGETATKAQESEKEAKEREKQANERAALAERLQYILVTGIQDARKIADPKQALASIESTLDYVARTKADYDAAATKTAVSPGSQAGGGSGSFTPACTLPFKGLRNPEIDDHCGIQGGRSDAATQAESVAKNNFCTPAHNPEAITYQGLLDLQGKAADIPKKPVDRAEIQRLGEGKLVSYVALIGNAHYADTASGEAVNCNIPGNNANDIHIPLMPDSNDMDECRSTTAEISPHYRPLNWTPAILNALKKPVRIRGMLFFDNTHKACAGNARPNPKRASVWEIHPVYSIDVCKMNDLEQCRASNNPADWAPVE